MTACTNASSSQSEEATESTAQSSPASAAPANCQDAEYRQLDFWLGEWDLTWTQADGSEGKGSNSITQEPYGNCVIMENFDGAPTMQFKGMSVSTWHKPAGVWRQTWVDDQGGYFALSGGPGEDGVFALEMTRLSENAPHRRMIWVDVTENSLVWRWQGKQATDAEWADLWVINYARKSAS